MLFRSLDALIERLYEKAAGKRNAVGDTWGDWVCKTAASVLAEQQNRIAALEAERDQMREPTEAMIVAGVKTLMTGHDSQRHYVAAVWRRMFSAAIDAARGDKLDESERQRMLAEADKIIREL